MSFLHFSRKLAAFIFVASVLPAFCPGALTWDALRVTLTTKPNDKEAVGLYHFVNTGNSTVTITSVQASCGCTTAEPDKRVYAPGEAGVVRAVFTLGDRVGEQEKNIYVVTDDTSVPPVQLTLQVMIPELLTCAPRLLIWNVGGVLDEKTAILSANSKLRISTVEVSAPATGEVKARIESVETGVRYQLLVRPVSSASVMNVAIAGVATFADGTKQPFKVYALVR